MQSVVKVASVHREGASSGAWCAVSSMAGRIPSPSDPVACDHSLPRPEHGRKWNKPRVALSCDLITGQLEECW